MALVFSFCFLTKLLILHETSTGNFLLFLFEKSDRARENKHSTLFSRGLKPIYSILFYSILGIVSASSTASANVSSRQGFEHKKSVTFDDGFKPGVEAAAAAAAATNIMASHKTRTNAAEVEQVSPAFQRGSIW